jgi:type IV pilus assembly protein PilE
MKIYGLHSGVGTTCKATPLRINGFTLIEVMIVVAIIAILTSVALPSYTDYNRRATVPEATTALADHRNKMEQFFLDNRNYGATNCGIANSSLKYYDVSCVIVGAGTGYTATATGKLTATGFVFTVNQSNVQRTTGLPASWTTPTLPVDRWVTKKGG